MGTEPFQEYCEIANSASPPSILQTTTCFTLSKKLTVYTPLFETKKKTQKKTTTKTKTTTTTTTTTKTIS